MATPKRRLPTGTVTFLFTDIEGSTRLTQALGASTYRKLLVLHNRLLRGSFEAHGGAERGMQGDSFLVVFRDARSAVAAAVEGQRALAGARWPAGATVRVRMGMHSGEAIRGADDYVGIDINRAARIAAAGRGGQVLVSDSTRALVERDLPAGASLRDLGRHRLKDLEQPEHLFQVIAEDLLADFPPLTTAEGLPGNLPIRLTSFVGREGELAELERLLGNARLLTLSGPGGTGSFRMAPGSSRWTQLPILTWWRRRSWPPCLWPNRAAEARNSAWWRTSRPGSSCSSSTTSSRSSRLHRSSATCSDPVRTCDSSSRAARSFGSPASMSTRLRRCPCAGKQMGLD